MHEAQTFWDAAIRRQRVGADPLVEEAMSDESLERLARLYQAADADSLESASIYRRTLAIIALASTALTVAFLLYDEAEAWVLIFVVGLMLVCELVAMRRARRLRCHERYVQLRVLAECLRVEAYLHYGGCPTRASEILPWSLRQDLGWVEQVLQAWEQGAPAPTDAHNVRQCWVEGQRRYHERAIASAADRYAKSQQLVHVAMVASGLLYVFTLLFELACGGWAMPVVVPVANLDLWRAALKILLGTASAMTIFVNGYFDKLSFGRVLEDHRKMAELYAQASERLQREGQTADALVALAREELVENSNWYAYQQGNAPEMSL